MRAMKPTVSETVQAAAVKPLAPAMATTIAKRHQAVTSSTAAQAMVVVPR